MNRLLKVMIILALTCSVLGCGGIEPPFTYDISGWVKTSAGAGIPSVNVSFSGGTGFVGTNSNGFWIKTGLSKSVVITPNEDFWAFTPTNKTVSGAANNVNFTGTPKPTRLTIANASSIPLQDARWCSIAFGPITNGYSVSHSVFPGAGNVYFQTIGGWFVTVDVVMVGQGQDVGFTLYNETLVLGPFSSPAKGTGEPHPFSESFAP